MPPGGEDAARAFYSGLLGLAEIPKPAPLDTHGGCWFLGHGILPGVASGISIHLGVEEPFIPARKAHVGLLVDDLPRLRSILVEAGVEVRDDRDIGVRRFYAFDPFGNRLELIDHRDQGFSARDRSTTAHEAGDPPAWAGRASGPVVKQRWLGIGIALIVGLAAAAVDARPGFDDTGVLAFGIAIGAALAAVASRGRSVPALGLLALAAGLPVPVIEIGAGGSAASLVALVFAAIGAAIGGALTRLVGPRSGV